MTRFVGERTILVFRARLFISVKYVETLLIFLFFFHYNRFGVFIRHRKRFVVDLDTIPIVFYVEGKSCFFFVRREQNDFR